MSVQSTRFNRWRRARFLVLVALVASALMAVVPAMATHPEQSLPGSNFEIDTDANLKLDDAFPSLDWASVAEDRKADTPSGKGDDSYTGGAKEDDVCPSVSTGSIPPNKSDLLNFGFYVEEGSPGFLHLFWHRVQEPSGTTLMDFELNQSGVECSNGVNKERTAGDLLIEYRLEQGGATAQILLREWTGSAWGPAMDLTGTDATGTINNSAIPASESDGLGAISPRTFGEASIDLDVIFDGDSCTSFGSVFLKSRSSTSFTSALKDFIGPQSATISNCGRIVVEKVDNQNARLAGAQFTVTPGKTTNGSTATSSVMSGVSTGLFCIDNLLLNVEYNVSETQTPANYLPAADKKFTVTQVGSCANVTSTTTPDLTFVNQPATRDVRLVKQDDDGNALPGVVFTLYADADGDGALQNSEKVNGVTATTDASGVATWTGLVVGKYCVEETGPVSGYTGLTNPVCFTLAAGAGAFSIPGGPFVNPQEHRIIVLVCHEGTNTLAPSDVTLGSQTLTSRSNSGLTAAEEAALCAITGARFGGLDHGNESLTVDVGSGAHTP